MTKFLLSVHVLAAILAIGPVAVAGSMFPAAARRASVDPDDPHRVGALRTLHRICRVYAAIGIAVPVFGLATASSMDVLGDAWLIVSIALTAIAAGVLVLLVLPSQERALSALTSDLTSAGPAPTPAAGVAPGSSARLAMHTGLFNVLWAVVTVLMIVRPGSTTGA